MNKKQPVQVEEANDCLTNIVSSSTVSTPGANSVSASFILERHNSDIELLIKLNFFFFSPAPLLNVKL